MFAWLFGASDKSVAKHWPHKDCLPFLDLTDMVNGRAPCTRCGRKHRVRDDEATFEGLRVTYRGDDDDDD